MTTVPYHYITTNFLWFFKNKGTQTGFEKKIWFNVHVSKLSQHIIQILYRIFHYCKLLKNIDQEFFNIFIIISCVYLGGNHLFPCNITKLTNIHQISQWTFSNNFLHLQEAFLKINICKSTTHRFMSKSFKNNMKIFFFTSYELLITKWKS